MKIRIFTDGACSNNPGPGGWAAVFNLKEKSKKISGRMQNTTNNMMELMAVVKSLEEVIRKGFYRCKVIEIYSDSAYVINAINNGWVQKWKSNGWKTSKGDDVKNRNLWESFLLLKEVTEDSKVKVVFIKVKGHSGNVFNEMADELARKQSMLAKDISLKLEEYYG